MALLSATPIHLSEVHRQELEAIVRKRTAPHQLVTRATLILLAAQGKGVRATTRELRVARATVQAWRQRWLSAPAAASVAQRLADEPRPGRPATYTAEQICAIVALACERPADSARPTSHWTQQELADEAMKRGVVEFVSQRSVGRFLKRSRPETASRSRVADAQAR